jgi:uncharacterized membrane protein YfcA
MLPEIILVAAFSGLVQGVSGFAFGLVATSLWAWMMAPQLVVPLVVLGSLMGQVISIQSVRHDVTFDRVAPFLAGGALGAPVGTLILPLLNVHAFRACVGLCLVLYCSVMLRARRLPRVEGGGKRADACVGFVAGAMGGASGMAGPPITLWCSLRGWTQGIQRATYQSFFIGTQVLTLTLFAWQGIIDAESMRLFACVAPAIVLSSWLGARVARRFSDLSFQRVVFVLLLASGATLLLPSLWSALQHAAA